MTRLECVACQQGFILDLDPKVLAEIRPGDMIKMSCPKCQAEWAQYPKTEKFTKPGAASTDGKEATSKRWRRRRARRPRASGKVTSMAILKMKKPKLTELIKQAGGEVPKGMGVMKLRALANQMRKEGKLAAGKAT